jgi:hypothetical protein
MFSKNWIFFIIIPETTPSLNLFEKSGRLLEVVWFWFFQKTQNQGFFDIEITFFLKIQNQRLFENSNNHTTLVPTYPPTKVPTLPTYLPTYLPT